MPLTSLVLVLSMYSAWESSGGIIRRVRLLEQSAGAAHVTKGAKRMISNGPGRMHKRGPALYIKMALHADKLTDCCQRSDLRTSGPTMYLDRASAGIQYKADWR